MPRTARACAGPLGALTGPGSVQGVRLRQAGPVTASGSLFALAGLHAAWGAGSAWPFPDRRALADAVIGAADVPGPGACFAVSGALAVAGALVAGWPAGWPVARKVGVTGVAVVLGGRGALGLAGRTQLVSPSSGSVRFSRLDRRVYSPLCLALAAMSAMSAWPVKRSGADAARCSPKTSGARPAGSQRAIPPTTRS